MKTPRRENTPNEIRTSAMNRDKYMVSNLQLFNNEGLELIINSETGESFSTVSGYARMSGKDKSTISRRIESVAKNLVNRGEIPTSKGIQPVALISEDLMVEWLPKDNPEMATKITTNQFDELFNPTENE